MSKPEYSTDSIKQKASGEKKENSILFKKLKKLKSSNLDKQFHSLHDKYMELIDCLDCGNCCKSISPAVKDTDIVRLSKYLKIKQSDIVEKYFLLDEDGDYVFRNQPCPFLGEDNYCSVYDARPKACREYPHTDRVKMQQILDITYKNISVCPIVYEIVKELREEYH